MKTTFPTNYRTAVEWCNNSFVLCNNLPQIDDSVIDNAEFDWYNEETEEQAEIFQWYITDCNPYDKDFLKNHFGLLFTYSNLLDCYILCVDHYGTSWDYVYCECDFEQAKRELGERK